MYVRRIYQHLRPKTKRTCLLSAIYTCRNPLRLYRLYDGEVMRTEQYHHYDQYLLSNNYGSHTIRQVSHRSIIIFPLKKMKPRGCRSLFAPGGFVLTMTAARKGIAQAFSFGGLRGVISRQRPAIGKRLFGAAAEPSNTTPPESPLPPPGDDDLVSFYLLRHGQTNFNAIGRIQGTLDSSVLTEQGISQAVEAGKILASAVDLELGPTVVVSPMTRARQTLECVREELQHAERDFDAVEIVRDIREIELFEWEGELKEDIIRNSPDEYATWVEDPSNFNFSGRYPAKDLWARAGKAWDEIRSLQSIQGQRSTLLVAHNAINQALVFTAFGCDTTYFRKLAWPNCAVLELQWRRGAERAERYRWVIPEPSSFVEAADAARILKTSADDNRFTL